MGILDYWVARIIDKENATGTVYLEFMKTLNKFPQYILTDKRKKGYGQYN